MISLSNIINCVAFLANFGLVDISSQFILSKAAFFLSSSHALFLFRVCIWYSVNKYLAGCIFCLYGYFGKSNLDTVLKCRNLLRPIFSVILYIIKALAALQIPLCNFDVFLVDFSNQIACSFLSAFSLDQNFYHNPRVFCSNARLMMALTISSIYLSVIYLESHFLHFPFFLFALLYPIAFLTASSVTLFSSISVWAGI